MHNRLLLRAALAAVATLSLHAAAQTVTAAPGKGLTVKAADDSFSITFKARAQLRETLTAGPTVTNEFGLRTARVAVQGHLLTPHLRYLLQLALAAGDFEPGVPSPVVDAYLEYVAIRDLQIRAGQFYVLFDRARTVRESALQFVDRQQALTELNLDRDAGLTLFSPDLLGMGGRLNYAVGVFGGSGRNRSVPETPGLLYVARIGFSPFGPFDDDSEGDLQRLATPRLALGLAGAFNQHTNRARSTTGATLTLGTFSYTHAAADAVFKISGLSFLGEVIYRQSSTPFLDGMAGGMPVREWSRSGWGYIAQAGYMVTDKVEISGRWDQLFALGPTDPALQRTAQEQGNEAGVGVNYYLNGHLLKLQADYTIRFGTVAPVHLARAQVDASF